MGTGGIWRALRGLHDDQAEETWLQHQRDQAALDEKWRRQRDHVDQKLADARARMVPRPITAERLANLRLLQEPAPQPFHTVKGFDVTRIDPAARTLLIMDQQKKIQEADARVADPPQPPPGPSV